MQTDQNNTQGRLFLALFLSLAVWMGINYIFFPPKPQATKQIIEPMEEVKPTASTTELKQIPETKPLYKKEDIKNFSLKTDAFLISFSNLGGKISEYYIRNHKEPDGTDFNFVKDDKFKTKFDEEDILAVELSRFEGFDFNIINNRDSIPNSEFNSILFQTDFKPEQKRISFVGLSPDGKYKIHKTYQFFDTENYFKFTFKLENISKDTIELSNSEKDIYLRSFSSLGPVLKNRTEFNDRDAAHYFRYFFLDGSFKDFIDSTSTQGFFDNMFGSDTGVDSRFEIRKASETGVDFVGTGSRYFIAVLDPLDHKPSGVLLDNRKGNETGVLLTYNDWILGPGKSIDLEFAAYVGVRELDGTAFRNKILDPKNSKESPFQGLSDSLDKSFNQGLTTPLRNGIVWILKKVYLIIPNYGWAIIVFAILFKAAFYPLNKKQAESMKKMQELSPQIKAINEKYEDPKVRQEKTMELYRKHGTNPLSGCLPMVVQIPIFIALYTAFSDTVDLWSSPFLWINDLSEPDTVFLSPVFPILGRISLNVLPLIMVATQIVQSRMTTVPTDPNQKMMMYLMPVIMLYFFWSMPSGVTLYWTMQNVLSIGQQFYTNKFGKSDKSKTLGGNTAGDSSVISEPAPKRGFRQPSVKKKKKK